MGKKVKYKAVIFDLFGTLVDNFSLQEYESVLAEMAVILEAPVEEFKRQWLATFRERTTGILPTLRANIDLLCQQLEINPSETQIENALETRLTFTIRAMVPKPGSVEMITQLKSDGLKIALISDCSSEVPTVWQDTPLVPLFNVTVFSCKVGTKKPSPQIYNIATEQMGVQPEDCLYVGDGSSQELTGALAVGMHPVLIRDPNEVADAHTIDREEWQGEVISSLEEVLTLLK